ncbi:MAG TPA: pyruvate, phosphate dikinase [Anaerolineae bacterium]|nr:pyruvate, phosphate dikinase [Anaerolineae bacterium]
MSQQWIVPLEAGSEKTRQLLGGKGAGLAEMVRLGISTLPGFIITTEAWKTHTPGSRSLRPDLWKEIKDALSDLERKTGRAFGSPQDPLIVSVRSSPLISMPGQLKTVLNVGLNDDVLDTLTRQAGDPGFARELLARLIQMYGEAVRSMPKGWLSGESEGGGQEECAEGYQAESGADGRGCVSDDPVDAFRKKTGEDFPQDPYVQLERSVAGVFDSWFGEKARQYRESQHIPHDQGTAVVVQQMAFGNLGSDSGSGVVFSRSPATGERGLYGEYLPHSQGEQVVAGGVTPGALGELAEELPQVYEELRAVCARLEEHYRDVQDVEFTVERGKLWILQTRAGTRTPLAAVKVVVDMAKEGLISQSEAVGRVDAALIGQVFVPVFADASRKGLVARGIQSSPGAATGQVVIDAGKVEATVDRGLPVILVREETTADDAAIMPLVSGILTGRGGATSHAAVVARGLNKPCVVGCQAMTIDHQEGVVRFGDVCIEREGYISIDGTTGEVFSGWKEVVSPQFGEVEELHTLLSWADGMRRLRVLADVSVPAEIETVLEWGIEGVGLCRTERLYYDSAFLPVFQEAMLASSSASRTAALEKLETLHRQEFRALLRAAGGHPLTVRLLHAPLDHFLPERDALLTELTELRQLFTWNEEIGRKEELLRGVDAWRQSSPGCGLRGARLALAVPEFVEAQVEALFLAACDLADEHVPSNLSILIPFVSHSGEIECVLRLIRAVAQRTMEMSRATISYRVGAVVETPRAASVAGELANMVDFLCIDTDGLTEAAFCVSRDEGRRFLPAHAEEGITAGDPFTSLDVHGVGSLVRWAVERARAGREGVEIGACGNHCQDRRAVQLFDESGLDFLSCHPAHLLKARLMAGQIAGGV